MISTTSFRADYTEFGSISLYPNPAIQYWINVAGMLLTNTSRWGLGSPAPVAPAATILDVATELFVAHNLALEKQADDAARRGGTPGTSVGGVVSSKSVGGVSVSYDTSSGIDEGAGHWNLTTYGTRLYRLFQLFGSGPVQVGIGWDPWQPGITPLAFVPPTGTITFTLNPAAGTTITLGAAKVTFVAGVPASVYQVQIAANLAATMIALLQLLEASVDDSIDACDYALQSPAPPTIVLDVVYKELGPTGNGFVIATTVAGAYASGPTLVGPIRTNETGFGQDPWLGPPPWPGQTMFG